MTWMIFWCSVVLALGALAWVSVEVVALEKREAIAQLNASRQELIRRALWRMDSRMAPILAVEASRPFTDYKSLEDQREQWLLNAGIDQEQAALLPVRNYSYANSYFEFINDSKTDDDQIAGQFSSHSQAVETESSEEIQITSRESKPDVQGNDEGLAFGDYAARKRVADIAKQNTRQETSKDEQWDRIEDESLESSLVPGGATREESALKSGFGGFSDVGNTLEQQAAKEQAAIGPRVGTLEPKWVADNAGIMQLVLVRSAVVNNESVIQGVWLDWNALRTDLLESVSDVMPGSSLVAVTGPRSSMIGGYQLATIPVEFIPSTHSAVTSFSWSPATLGILVTWIAIISTIIAVGIVLRAAIVLSQRRGRFVSAVTHELRTPLTTFRLYSQMLADGMVSDEQVRTDYLQTLKRESERLTGIVENVLEYARLTRTRSSKDKPAGVQTISPGALIARFRPLLARRAGQSNMDLVVSLDLETHQDRTLRVDPHAVERIMMNLIENACKYAVLDEQPESDEADTRIHLDVTINDQTLELLVADHGKGIDAGEESKIFGEFQRGWRGLANARSGLGLGLALSRGLAREMKGDLILTTRRGHGAEFLLTLELDELS